MKIRSAQHNKLFPLLSNCLASHSILMSRKGRSIKRKVKPLHVTEVAQEVTGWKT